jgi:tetratricopeptide (TPR) repeat protein
VQDVDTLAGLCLLLRASTLREIGPFDERFGHGNCEDDDYCLRLRQHGYRLVIARRAFLHHEGHATFRALGLDVREQITRRMAQFADKWAAHAAGRATIAALRGDLEAAAAAAHDARREWPRWPDAELHAGRFYAQRGDAVLAVRCLTAFLQQCPAHVDARLELGLAALRCGDGARGAAVLGDTVARYQLSHDQQRRLLQRLGQLAYERGAYADAERHFQGALELQPASGELCNWLGLCRLGCGDHDGAAVAFLAAIEHGNALAHTNLGICRHAQGDQAAARSHFRTACELLPDDRVARANYDALHSCTG